METYLFLTDALNILYYILLWRQIQIILKSDGNMSEIEYSMSLQWIGNFIYLQAISYNPVSDLVQRHPNKLWHQNQRQLTKIHQNSGKIACGPIRTVTKQNDQHTFITT